MVDFVVGKTLDAGDRTQIYIEDGKIKAEDNRKKKEQTKRDHRTQDPVQQKEIRALQKAGPGEKRAGG